MYFSQSKANLILTVHHDSRLATWQVSAAKFVWLSSGQQRSLEKVEHTATSEFKESEKTHGPRLELIKIQLGEDTKPQLASGGCSVVLGFSKGVRRGIFDPNMLRPVSGWPCMQAEPSPDLGICGELIPGTKTNTGNNHLAFLWSSATFL